MCDVFLSGTLPADAQGDSEEFKSYSFVHPSATEHGSDAAEQRGKSEVPIRALPEAATH